ncbi:hypothetical protein BGX26_007373 [Mortierella sp. AD094]|nr:hypothetical protein BGX26_007373 [Mortierella sp. AD094]
MSAIPVAFLINNDHSHVSLAKWLAHIKDEIGTPEYITSDDAQVEYLTIRKAFGEEVTVHLCLWHVIKAWARKFSSLIISAKGTRAKNKELREAAIAELRSILYEPDLTRVCHKIADFKAKWETHNEGKL